jgi:hypothetical protein
MRKIIESKPCENIQFLPYRKDLNKFIPMPEDIDKVIAVADEKKQNYLRTLRETKLRSLK